MLPEQIMQSDLLDILFDNRNKTYGAYALRRSYTKTMIYFISLTFFIAITFSIFQFMDHKKEKMYARPVIITPDQEPFKFAPVNPQTKPALQQPAKHFNRVIYSAPVITKDNYETEMPTIEDLNKNMIGSQNLIGDGVVDIVQPPANTNEGTEVIAAKPVEVKSNEGPLTFAQVMPEYPGGVEALREFMLKNLRQPDNLQPGEKVIVKAFFVVNKTGKIEQVKIISTGRYDLNKEVERVINKMPLWKPGMQNGNAVAVYFNLPVTFLGQEE